MLGGLENWNLLHKWGFVETQLLRTVALDALHISTAYFPYYLKEM